ncbi:hypothetical protein WEH80_24665 [Actinomycetes bacterium KLBMP 9759]
MQNLTERLADWLVAVVVPKTTADACGCNGCVRECVGGGLCTTECALVCRGCTCGYKSHSCLPWGYCSCH